MDWPAFAVAFVVSAALTVAVYCVRRSFWRS
jgi:hypothetical protein